MNLIIRFLAWCCHVIAATVPGKSGDGPPCIVEFAGVKSKPASPVGVASSAGVWTLFAKGHINIAMVAKAAIAFKRIEQ